MPVVEPGVVASDEVGEHARGKLSAPAGVGTERGDRVQRPGGRVGFVPGWDAAFDVGVGAFADVVLKARPIFAEVVPEPGQAGPVGAAEKGCLGGCAFCDLLQVVCQCVGAGAAVGILGRVGKEKFGWKFHGLGFFGEVIVIIRGVMLIS